MQTSRSTAPERPGDVAIVGIHARLPGARDLAEFRSNLERGAEAIAPVPADRWWWPHETPRRFNAGFIAEPDCFDAGFFTITPKEAASMDPQQRLVLESCHSVLEDAGVPPSSLAGRRVGVFVGIGHADYPVLMREAEAPVDAYRGTGMALTAVANRVSYLFDLRGPSHSIDTACSSSLVALHRAIRSMAADECEAAIVGGVNLILGPELHVAFEKAEMLSPHARCRTFDAEADGYVRGEGVATLYLKRVEAARADGDFIYAVVKGTAENHGGRAHAFTAPNPEAQAAVITAAWRQSGMPLQHAAFVETHGTATPLGDPIEVEGLKRALAADSSLVRDDGELIKLGALKSHLGHLEAAAGIAGIVRAVLMLRDRKVFANRHFQALNPHISLDGTPFAVAANTSHLRPVGALAAGVSSFGFGGVNAHAVLVQDDDREAYADDGDARRLICLSAKSSDALVARVRQLLTYLGSDDDHETSVDPDGVRRSAPRTILSESERGRVSLSSIAFSLLSGRDVMEERLAFVARGRADCVAKLQGFLSGARDDRGAWVRRTVRKRDPEIASPVEMGGVVTLDAWAAYWTTSRRPRIDWAALHPAEPLPVRIPLPAYPFRREPIWYAKQRTASRELASPSQPPTRLATRSAPAETPAQAILAGWRTCWATSPYRLPSSLIALSIVCDAHGDSSDAWEGLRFGRPHDVGGLTARGGADGERLQIVEEGPASGVLFEARITSRSTLRHVQIPGRVPVGQLDAAAFHLFLSSVGLTLSAAHRLATRVELAPDRIAFDLDLPSCRSDPGLFWSAVLSHAVLGLGWMADPGLRVTRIALPLRAAAMTCQTGDSGGAFRLVVFPDSNDRQNIVLRDTSERTVWSLLDIESRAFPVARASGANDRPLLERVA